MKAAIYREHDKDPRKVVNIEDIDVPKIKYNQVLIKVEAASYNYNDLWGIWGEPIKIPLPHISGSDVSGTVVDIGENVLDIKKGDRIAFKIEKNKVILKKLPHSDHEYLDSLSSALPEWLSPEDEEAYNDL